MISHAIKKTAAIGCLMLLGYFYTLAQIGKLDTRFYNKEGLGYYATCVLVLPDSSIVVGGDFSSASGRDISRIAKFKKDGTNDYGFDPGTGFNGTVLCLALQADGKLLVGGDFTNFNGTAINRIARLNADGSLDSTFNTGTGCNAAVRGVALQPDGKVLAVGDFTAYKGNTISKMVRIKANGDRDSTFVTGTNTNLNTLALQPDGKVVVGGTYNATYKSIRRHNADGSVDTAFTVGLTNPSLPVQKLCLLADGKICAVGNFLSYNGTAANHIVMLDPDGTINANFTGGAVGFNHHVYDIIQQPDGKLVACGGFSSYNGTSISGIVRFDTTGTRDTGFNPGSGTNEDARGLALYPSGGLVLAGRFTSYNGYCRPSLARINASGSIDHTFFNNTGLNGNYAWTIGTQGSGKTILGGDFTRYGAITAGRIARLDKGGNIDTTFNTGGSGFNNMVTAVKILANDKILVAGRFTQYNGTTVARIVRLNTDGSLDNTFSAGTNGNIECMATDVQGRIYIGGTFTTVNSVAKTRLARIGANGATDNGFAVGTFSSGALVYTLAVQPDGKLLVGGGFATYMGAAASGLCRIDTNGIIDTAFSSYGGANDVVRAIALDASGKVIVAGQFTMYNGYGLPSLARLKATGAVDSTYKLNSITGRGLGLAAYNGGVVMVGDFGAVNGIAGTAGMAYIDSTGAVDTAFFRGTGISVSGSTPVCAHADTYNGRVLVGGLFQVVQDRASQSFAGFIGKHDGVAIDSIRIDTLLCAGGTAKVIFKKTKHFNEGNVFTVLMSDGAGSFASPVVIGDKAAEGAGWDSIPASVPDNALGNGYRVKIASSNAVSTGGVSNVFKVDTLRPAPPIPPASQALCSDTGYTFVFDSIQTSAVKIEWALDSAFSQSHIINASGMFSLHLGVGESQAVWLRSMNEYGCTSDAVATSATVTSIKQPYMPTAYGYDTDTSRIFLLDTILLLEGDQIEWSLSGGFDYGSVTTPPLNLSIETKINETDTLWIRSRNSITGCVSRTIETEYTSGQQVFSCGVIDSVFDDPSFLSVGSNPDCSDKPNYSPDLIYPGHRPIVTIYVNFHYIGRDDGSGMWNQYNNGAVPGNTTHAWDDMYYISEVFLNGFNTTDRDGSNDLLATNMAQTCPVGNTWPAAETQYRYEIYRNPEIPDDRGVYFHASTADYQTFCNGAGCQYGDGISIVLKTKYSVNGSKVHDIFFLGPGFREKNDEDGDGTNGEWLNDRCGTPGGIASGIPSNITSMATTLTNVWCTLQSPNNQSYYLSSVSRLINHEIGHNLGLYHTNSFVCDDVDHSNACYDGWATNHPPTNNMMGYNGHQDAVSQCQLGTIHYNIVGWQYLSAENQNMMKLDFCEITDPDLVVNAPGETILWNSARNMTSNIVLEAGTTLKITCTVGMPKDAHIIVKAGAKLWVADGGTITNICGDRWQGIVMEGDKTQAQHLSTPYNATAMGNQPFVYLEDATIENAEVGVSVWKTSDGWVDASTANNIGGTGGIVRAVGSTFKNNGRDVGFMWYQNLQGGIEKPNLSYFHDCHFVSDDSYYGGRVEHVSLWGVRGVKFLGCKFENAQVLNPPVEARFLGRGIVAVDAAIEVDYFPGKRSSFKNLHEGIHLGCGPNNLYPSKVMNSDFEQCYRGIRNEGADLATIVGNHFTIGGNLAYMTDYVYDSGEEYLLQEGLVMHDATGFVVEQNTFSKHEATTTPIVGIRADATGGNYNEVYNNEFNEMAYANLANRQNQYTDYLDPVFVPTGLTYWCNSSNSSDYIDLAVTDPDPNDLYQIFTGVRPAQGQSNLSAGNTFSHSSSLMASDLNNRSFYSDMRYWYFGAQTVSNVEYPAYVTLGTVASFALNGGDENNECPSNYTLPTEEDPIGGCPTCPNMTGLEDIFGTNNTALKAGKLAYNSLIDGGVTSTLLAYIDTTTNADTLVARLAPYAPNLSTLVLDKIAHNNVLDTTRKYLLIKANAEGLTSEILDYLDRRLHMPQWMVDSLSAARSQLTYRTYLLDTLMQYSAAREQAGFAALRLISEDTTGLDLDTYRAWLDSLGSPWSYGQMLGTYMYEGRYDTLPALLAHYDSLLNDAYDSLAFANLGGYLSDHAAWLAADTSIMNLDSLHHAELLAQANGSLHHLKGTQAARNVLAFFYDSLYFAPGMLPDLMFAKKGDEEEKTSVKEAAERAPRLPALKIYPNPAKDYLIVEYGFAESQAVLVTDLYGRVMATQQIGGRATKVEINTTNFGSGMYFLRIEEGGKAVEKAKFNIMK